MPGRAGMRRTARRTSRRTSRRVNRRQDGMNTSTEPEQYYDEPAPAPAPAPALAAEVDPYEQLKEAKKLLDEGILTEEEFAAEKKKLLG